MSAINRTYKPQYRIAGKQYFRAKRALNMATGKKYPAILGDGDNNLLVYSRGVGGDYRHYGKYYIRFQGGVDSAGKAVPDPPTEAYVTGVAFVAKYGANVLVERHPTRDGIWLITAADAAALADGGYNAIELNPLANQHKITLIRDIADAQSMAISTTNSNSSIVTIHQPYVLWYDGTAQILDSNLEIDLANDVPVTGEECLCMVYYNPESVALERVVGTARTAVPTAWEESDMTELYSTMPSIGIPLGVYLLADAVEVVRQKDWRIEPRQVFHSTENYGFPSTIENYVVIPENRHVVTYGMLLIEGQLLINGGLLIL